jgi:hypothetical protein
MGISLNGLTPAGTYPGLIKTGDNTAISGTPKVLSDGNGNNLPMEVSTTGVNLTGSPTVNAVAIANTTQVAAKQDTLVSGTNIKTINSTSILGSGNINVVTSPSGVAGAIQFSNGSAFASDAANLFWDDINNRLGVGLNNPTQTADILGNVKIASATSGLLIRDFTAFNTFKAFYKASETPSDSNYLIALDTDVLINSRGSGTDISYNNSLRARFGNATSLLLKGSGSTSATTSLLVQNSAGASSLQVTDDGSVYNLGKGSISTNTVFGRASFGANITGSENVAIGFDVLSANTSGQLNTAVGNSSLKANTNGIENVAVGVFALGNNTGGNANVAIGRSALGGNLTGSNNCAIGFDTQTGNFSSSVILGRSATATASNQFVVGSTAHNAGAVNSTTDVPATFLWSVRINGTNYKILMTT